jgi:intermembrane space import and assembly protein 40
LLIAAVECLETSIHKIAHEEVPTIDAVLREKRVRAAARAEDEKKKAKEARRAAAEVEQSLGDNGSETAADTAAVAQEATIDETSDATMDNLEEEAGQQGAFNPETGEINWDCPCLGGMAHGPCGPEFREAFSCFVYSNDEPKGMECIDKFKYVFSSVHGISRGSQEPSAYIPLQ